MKSQNPTIKELLEQYLFVCPKCGKTLVERRSKKGKFIGCINYPACTFTIYPKQPILE
jgi:ssDNA-binding Zn-finger/Zn-ribbon topoisomerase 1